MTLTLSYYKQIAYRVIKAVGIAKMFDPKALTGMDAKMLASMGMDPKMFESKSADVAGTAGMDPNVLKYMSIDTKMQGLDLKHYLHQVQHQ